MGNYLSSFRAAKPTNHAAAARSPPCPRVGTIARRSVCPPFARTDVTKLVGADCLDAASLEEMVMRVNRDKFLAVEVPGAGYRVLLTPEGQLGGGLTFLDPQGRQALLISHAEQRCTGVKALDAATSAACEGAERVRASVHAAMSRYAADKVLRASSCATVAARLSCTAEGRDGGEERPKGREGRQRRTAVGSMLAQNVGG